jgi:allantoin racemase
MRILLVNPNTTQAVTDRMAAAAASVAAPGTTITAVTAAFGAAIIGTRVETAIAGAAVVEALAEHAAGHDAAIVAASIDPGLAAARELLGIPVVGITEAALHAACLLGGQVGAVTMGGASAVWLREMAGAYGLAGRLGPVEVLTMTPLELLADIPSAVAAIRAAGLRAVAAGADSLVLVGAVMAAMPEMVRDEMPVPVVEGVTAAVALCEALVRLRPMPARAGSYAVPQAARVHAALATLRRG